MPRASLPELLLRIKDGALICKSGSGNFVIREVLTRYESGTSIPRMISVP